MNPFAYTPFAAEYSNEKIDRATVKKLLNNWITYVNEENLTAVVNMYAENAILLPTLSDQIRIGRPEIQQYFIKFLGKDSLNGTVTKLYIQIADDTGIASGQGVFKYRTTGKKNAEWVEVDFRFSFVFQKGIQGWQILNHHSSLVP